jgi:Kef-type K+ transport system membrane component KefB
MSTLIAQAATGLRAEQVLGFVLLDLAIVLAVARLLGHAARRLGQPSVVGEILGGILLGPTLLGPALLGWPDPPTALHCLDALGPTGEPSVSSCLFPPQSRAVLGIPAAEEVTSG